MKMAAMKFSKSATPLVMSVFKHGIYIVRKHRSRAIRDQWVKDNKAAIAKKKSK